MKHRFVLGVSFLAAVSLNTTGLAAQTMPLEESSDAANNDVQGSTSVQNEGQPTDAFPDDIVVTAEKRAEGRSVQRVPLSIVAVGELALTRNLVANISEVSKLAANTTLAGSSVPGFINFNIRGLGLTSTVRTIDPAVGVFIDGAYVGYPRHSRLC